MSITMPITTPTTRARLAFSSMLLALTLAACGGRSGLRAVATASGSELDGGSYDAIGSHDGGPGLEVSPLRDGGGDAIRADALPLGDLVLGADSPFRNTDAPSADTRGFGTPDGRPDLGSPSDLPSGDAPQLVVDGPTATLKSISIYPNPITVNVGTPLTITVTAIYSNNTTQDVSSAASVTSANTTILTVAGATLTGLGTTSASTTITATYQTATATANVTVNGQNPLTSISINNVPTTALAVGATVNLTATGIFANGTSQDVTSQATWASSAAAVATVGTSTGSYGQVTALTDGTFTVTATVGAIVGTSAAMTVSSKTLQSIAITPTNPTLQVGLTNQPFVATGTYSDGSTGDVTQQATWASSATAVLTVVATGTTAGQVATLAAGTATLTATVGSISSPADTVTVNGSRLRTITASCPDTIVIGDPQPCTATGTYTDGSTADLTTSVTWASSATATLTISNATGSVGLASGVAAGTATVTATLGTVVGRHNVTVSSASLLSITVNAPASAASLIIGLTAQFTATGLYGVAGNTNTQFSIDVTNSATWQVASTSIASVSNASTSSTSAGLVTGLAAGTTTVTASLSGVTSTPVTVTVISTTLTSIAISPANASVQVGDTYNFNATGTYNNGTTVNITSEVTWTSGTPATATISNAAGSNGVATGVAASTTPVTITASMSGQTSPPASLTVNAAGIVSISISSTADTINTGATATYTVTAVNDNGTTTTTLTGVTWSSSDTAVATIAGNTARTPFGGAPAGATATGVATGTTTITASYTTAAGTTLTSNSLTLTVQTPPTVLDIRITPLTSTIAVGGTATYTVYVDYSDGTTSTATGATLTSSDAMVASVGGGGPGGFGGLTATGLAAGSTTITASYTSGGTTFTAPATLTVQQPTTAVGLHLTPASASVYVGGTQQFTAYTENSDGTTTDVTTNSGTSWTTSDGTLATITTGGTGGGGFGGIIFAAGGGGLATGVAAGSVTITATYTPASGSAVSGTATLTVKTRTMTGLVIGGFTTTSIVLNNSENLTATATYSDGTSSNVTSTASWTTSDATVLVMTNAATGGRGGGPGGPGIVGGGTADAVGVGKATVTASYTPSGSTTAFTASASFTVTNPTIQSFTVTPTNPTVYLSSGATQQFTATVVYSDYTTANVTTSAQWTSGTPAVADIIASGANIGRATGLTAGTSVITASYTPAGGSAVTATTTLTVAARQLTQLQVTPTNPTTHLGIDQGFVATALYDDGTTANVTTSVTWTSSTTTVATVSTGGGGPGGGAAGVATPVAAGQSTITATYGGQTGSSVLTVNGSTLSSIAITPSPLTLGVGATQQLTATGTYADGTTQTFAGAVWTTPTNSDVATVSNASGSVGLLTAVGVGSTTVTATFRGVSSSPTLSVTVVAAGTNADAGT
jgi:hypothetical protein